MNTQVPNKLNIKYEYSSTITNKLRNSKRRTKLRNTILF